MTVYFCPELRDITRSIALSKDAQILPTFPSDKRNVGGDECRELVE
jgi:hypothetical protein